MDILLAFIVGAALGIAAHFAAPHRATRGTAVGPVLGAIVGGAVWAAFTWSGVTTENPLIWLVSFALPFVVTYPVLALLGRARVKHDASERVRLKIS
ncbi:hypothetical protein ABC304_11655 [Microbacterium sp. 1P10UB]|uniref:hypothetical protein n=1 Tax=unclassified Microbacterium TaxID=2609290 RepID=UPI0039A384AC